jgi:hypothetical protein
MGHHDPVEVVERQVPGSGELAQTRDYRCRLRVDERRKLVERRWMPVLGERPVDVQPQRLEVQGYFFGFLPADFFADFGRGAASI